MTESLMVATVFWQPNDSSLAASCDYDPSWVDKLYRNFKRHLTVPFDFVVWTDKEYTFEEPVEQRRLTDAKPDYASVMQPFEDGRAMILVGLDTVVTGNIDKFAEYCLTAERMAVPRDPFFPDRVCNCVMLVPQGNQKLWTEWDRTQPAREPFFPEQKDMARIAAFDPQVTDDLWPGEIVSYKGHVMFEGVEGARIVYFHGQPKAHQLHEDWVLREWA